MLPLALSFILYHIDHHNLTLNGSAELRLIVEPPASMADDTKGAGEGSSSPSPAATQAGDRSQILAQANRFLTSANVSESASDEDKREFLRSKGLTEDEISRAFQDAKSPVDGLAAHQSGLQPSNTGDLDAFEIAARQFDDPINADAIAPPPKSYPNSPLALYYDSPAAQAHNFAHSDPHKQGGNAASPLTRYQVLLQFFRTLSYMMMLGGGLTAIVVSAYRAYILPKITAMFDARSIVLKHHIMLFDKLRSNVASLATYVPVQRARIGGDDASTNGASSPLKGVLKKVHFHDDVDTSAKEGEKEGVKLTQHAKDAKAGSDKAVMPGTDVVVDAKTPLLAEGANEADDDADASASEEGEAEPAKLEPIDMMASIRESMASLAAALRGDLAGNPSAASTGAAPSVSSSPSRGARVASVADAGSGSDEWEDEDTEADGSDDDDGLEFDPYGAYQKKHKHTQTSATSSSGSGSASLAGLKSTLASLNADISTHAFAASSSSSYSGGAFRLGPGSSGAESPKSGDLGQVKAEIRSLKGLLLSRRNFPSYGARPPPLPAAAASPMDARTSSTVV